MAKKQVEASGDPVEASGDPPGVQVRVLTRCAWGEPNDVVWLPAEAVEQAKDAGAVDPHPDAVAYALGLARASEALE